MEGTCRIFNNVNFWCVDSHICHTVINNLYLRSRLQNNIIQESMKVQRIICIR